MRVGLGILVVLLVGGGVWGLTSWRNQPPEASFVRVTREPIASSIPTNGKVEPIEWAEARADHAGAIRGIFIRRGASVSKGAALVELDAADARAELTTAQSRVTQARAELEVLDKGGRPSELTAIASDLDREKLELSAAQKEFDTLRRLQAKQAATAFEVTQSKDRIDRSQAQIRALEQRRAALTSSTDRSAAEARLRDSESAVALAQERMKKSVIVAPVAGTIYQFDLKAGGYLNAGDLVASIGRLEKVRVKVFVDEPDLGRVALGKSVAITWDAKPGVQWKGIVDRTPTQIVAMGTRQVGEVLCVIDNAKNELLPGTNVNAEIRFAEVASALTIPKEAVRRENGQTGVFVLATGANGSVLHWQTITLGISNTTRTQVAGLKEGDAVVLPSDKRLKEGMSVNGQAR
jgi:HlyD family secretion protein